MHIDDLRPEWRDTFNRAKNHFSHVHDLISAELEWSMERTLEEVYQAFSGNIQLLDKGKAQVVVGVVVRRRDYALHWRFITRLREDSFQCTIEVSIRPYRIDDGNRQTPVCLMLERYVRPTDGSAPDVQLRNPYCLYVPGKVPDEILPSKLIALLPESDAETTELATKVLSFPDYREPVITSHEAGELVLQTLVRGFKCLPPYEEDPLSPRFVIVVL